MNDTADLARMRAEALRLVNLARAAIGVPALTDLPRGVPGTYFEQHPVVAALWPCGARSHLVGDLTCETTAEAAAITSAWGQVPRIYPSEYVDFRGEASVLMDFIFAFDALQYPDLIEQAAA